MAAVHGIVSSHGGWINVTSAPGLGTTVQVYLPVVSYRKTTEFHMPEAQVDTGGTVLVIDDDESIRDLTLTMLKRLGYNAISASTGIEAVEQIRHYKHRIDLAILDIEMPDMKGTEIYPRLMEICPGLKVVVCSGYSINGPAESIIRAGAEVFMQKPFSFSELASVLQRLIERRKHKRYGVRDGHVVILGARNALPEPLVDISRGGVAVRHGGEHPVSRVWEQMSIVSGNGEFSIQGIPFQFIQKPTYHQGASAITKKNDLKNIRFGPLNPHQARQVEYFITHFTV
jgi:CheY-like chemotaxis protein